MLALLAWTFFGTVPDRAEGLGILFRSSNAQTPGEVEAVVWFAPHPRKPLVPGSDAQLQLNTVSYRDYGFLKGRVRTVANRPAQPEEVLAITGHPQLVSLILGTDLKIETFVTLLRDDATPSGYAWSSKTGPPFKLDGGTRVSASIIVGQLSPFRHYIAPYLGM